MSGKYIEYCGKREELALGCWAPDLDALSLMEKHIEILLRRQIEKSNSHMWQCDISTEAMIQAVRRHERGLLAATPRKSYTSTSELQ